MALCFVERSVPGIIEQQHIIWSARNVPNVVGDGVRREIRSPQNTKIQQAGGTEAAGQGRVYRASD